MSLSNHYIAYTLGSSNNQIEETSETFTDIIQRKVLDIADSGYNTVKSYIEQSGMYNIGSGPIGRIIIRSLIN